MTRAEIPTLEEYLEKVVARARRHYWQELAPSRLAQKRRGTDAANPRLCDKKDRSEASFGICRDCGKPCAYLRCPDCHRAWKEARDRNEQ